MSALDGPPTGLRQQLLATLAADVPANPIASWHDVPLLAIDEPLVRVYGARVRAEPAYRHFAEGLNHVWVRERVAARLEQASRLLPPGLCLIALDGWRREPLQHRLFDMLYEELLAAGLRGDELIAAVHVFVKAPCVDESNPFPHSTGGSVDVTLGDSDGVPLDMGSTFDEFTYRSATNYYEAAGMNTLFRDRRRLLCAVMADAGCSNYEKEWWHFDHGNQFHHFRVGGPARYGLAVPPRIL